jgi:hypothetical protein
VKLRSAGQSLKDKDEREGNLSIPIGGVVTVGTDAVDRGHTDAKRLPGVVVNITIHDEVRFYEVACIGGRLPTKYIRRDLIYEPTIPPSAYSLDGIVNDWKSLPKISLHKAVELNSITGGQGMIRYI